MVFFIRQLQVESVLVEHPDVAEAAVVAKPHSIKVGRVVYYIAHLKERHTLAIPDDGI